MNQPDSSRFYSKLPSFDDFAAIADQDNFWTLPSSWQLVVADIVDSTLAIERGKLKAVNIIGVSIITSLRNALRGVELPYMFGGDGATLCVPVHYDAIVRSSLRSTQAMAKDEFGLSLRIGIVPLTEIRSAGHEVLVARHRLSKNYQQAVFSGGGVEHAERLVKEGMFQVRELQEEEEATADYAGLECRWNQVPSRHGETIALIVRVTSPEQTRNRTYQQIIARINRLYGSDEECRPVYSSGLSITDDATLLANEQKLRTFGQPDEARRLYLKSMRRANLLGRVLMAIRFRYKEIRWGNYKQDLSRNTDFKKFDGTLRQVISGTSAQREALERYLEELRGQGLCVWGIHVSDAALVTCMIDNRQGEHYHFVDSAGGGYAVAAERMKAQLKELEAC